MSNETYYRPRSLDEALDLLRKENSVVLGGGTDLVAKRAHSGRRLIDCEALGLDYISTDATGVRYGAMTPIQRLIDEDPNGGELGEFLSSAAFASSPSWMIRNMGTIGGELAVRSRHSAIVTAMLALDAEVDMAKESGRSRLPVGEFYNCTRESERSPFIIVEVFVPHLRSGSRAAFRSISHLPSQRPIAAAAVILAFEGSEIVAASVALASSLDAPQRVYKFEQALVESRGTKTADAIRSLARQGLDEVQFASDYEGGPEYLREMSELVLGRTCIDLIERA